MTTLRLNDWFSSAAQLQGSVLPRILLRMLLFGGFSLLVAAAYTQGLWTKNDHFEALTGNVACNLVLGLLLVFRTNTAYERFWEGRKAWGTLIITTRNLAREIQVAIAAPTAEAKAAKEQALNRLVGFAIAVKCQLRREDPSDELKALLSESDLEQIRKAKRPPQLITLWLSHYLKAQEAAGHLDAGYRSELSNQVNALVESLSGCERIIKTPMPISYAIYLKRLIMLYCLLLPLGMVDQLGWWTPAAIVLISFVLLGVEEIGNDIEDPFGYGFNDLKLDLICETLSSDIHSVKAFTEDGKLVEKAEGNGRLESADPEADAPAIATVS